MSTVLFKVKYCYRWEQKDLLLQDSDLTTHIWSMPSTPRLAVETECIRCHQSENVLAERNYDKCTKWSDVRKGTICRFVSQLGFISSDSPKVSWGRNICFPSFHLGLLQFSDCRLLYSLSIFIFRTTATQSITYALTSLLISYQTTSYYPNTDMAQKQKNSTAKSYQPLSCGCSQPLTNIMN